MSALNVMAIRIQRHANISKQATLLDGLDVSRLKWRVCGCGLNRFVHEGMNNISNAKLHLKTRSGNVNMKYEYVFVMLTLSRKDRISSALSEIIQTVVFV